MKLVGRSLVLAALVSVSSPALVQANGRFPTAQHVLVGPGTASSTIVLRTTFGFVVSDDGGATFHWICELALGYPPMAPYDPPFAIDALGRLHVGLNDPGQQTLVGADRCTFGTDTALDGQYLQDLDNTPDGQTLVSITSSGDPAAQNRVYRSDDQGTTWRALGTGQPILYETVEVAPSNTQRVYATATLDAADPHATHTAFFRSDDGGATLTEMDTLPAGTVGTAYVAGVDPAHADTVYLRVVTGTVDPSDAGAPIPTVLLRTQDGGATWHEVARSMNLMEGFAVSDDGRTVWWGGPDPSDGLHRSDDGGDTFARIGDAAVLCLRQHAGVLYVCANYLLQTDHFALYRSHDEGATLEPLFALGNIAGAFSCTDASSPESTECAATWPTQRSALPPARSIDAGVPTDATGAAEMASHASSCGCTAPGARGRGPWFALAALAAALVGRRRRG